MKTLLYIAPLLLFVTNCKQENKEMAAVDNVEKQIKQIDSSKVWKYNHTTDELDATSLSYATLISLNQLELDYPYQGGTMANMMLLNEEVYLMINKGQFNRSTAERIRVRFDNQEPTYYNIKSPDKLDPTTLTITNSSQFIDKLRKSDSLKIQVAFVGDGLKVFNFRTTDLDLSKLN